MFLKTRKIQLGLPVRLYFSCIALTNTAKFQTFPEVQTKTLRNTLAT